MKIDIKGKINEKKLAYSNTLLPLFEAVVNSIQAIEENNSTSDGIINIDVIRSKQKELELSENTNLPEITDFAVEDNGIGFNERNFDSFNFAHSTYKPGGKGIGRFTWLRAFQKAEIESRFKENNQWYLRKFDFEPTKNGIENHHKEELLSEQNKRYTRVKLKGLKPDYRQWCNSKTEDIAIKIIEHAFVYFLSENCPRVLLKDLNKETVVNDLFHLYTKGQVVTKEHALRNHSFKLNILKLYNSKKPDNKIHYCANAREVIFDKIAIDIPELDSSLVDEENNQFSIAVYVEGDFLDENVNEERTTIAFSKGDIVTTQVAGLAMI